MDHEPGATHEAIPLDPEHDIDGNKAVWWCVGTCLAVFGCLYLLVPIFLQVQDAEFERKVNQSKTVELNTLTTSEDAFLDGKNPTGKNIDKIVESLRSESKK